jgi:hypothetical protein
MNACFPVIVVFLVGGSPSSGDDNEAVFKGSVRLMKEMGDLLKPIKDKAGAESALPKLKILNQELADLKKKEFRMSPEDESKLFAKHKASVDSAIQIYVPEVRRIAKIPEVTGVLEKPLNLFNETLNTMIVVREGSRLVAKERINRIDKAIQAYKQKNGKLPDSLIELNPTYLMESDLRDPWGGIIRYDPTGPRNQGNVPDVWAETPEGQMIGNWKQKPL